MLESIIPVAEKTHPAFSAIHSGHPQLILLADKSIVSISVIRVRVK
jgi:hypothetical protein